MSTVSQDRAGTGHSISHAQDDSETHPVLLCRRLQCLVGLPSEMDIVQPKGRAIGADDVSIEMQITTLQLSVEPLQHQQHRHRHQRSLLLSMLRTERSTSCRDRNWPCSHHSDHGNCARETKVAMYGNASLRRPDQAITSLRRPSQSLVTPACPPPPLPPPRPPRSPTPPPSHRPC